ASSLRPELPAAVDAVLDRALALSPADRFQTAREMREALRACLPEPASVVPEALVGPALWRRGEARAAAIASLLAAATHEATREGATRETERETEPETEL